MIGAGNGGFNLVAHLGALGHTMRLHDINEAKLTELRAAGGVDTSGHGHRLCQARTRHHRSRGRGEAAPISSSSAPAATGRPRRRRPWRRFSRTARPSCSCKAIPADRWRFAACWIRPDAAPGSISRKWTIIPIRRKKLGPAKIQPIVTKRWLQIASFPGKRIDTVFATLGPLFPTAVKAPNVIPPASPTPMRCSTSPIACSMRRASSTAKTYKFYAHGVTEGVARIYRAINAERVAAAAALGATVPTLEDWFDTRLQASARRRWSRSFQKLTYNAGGPLWRHAVAEIVRQQLRRGRRAGRAHADRGDRARRGRSHDRQRRTWSTWRSS